jgi:hypothetical protein
MLTRRAALTTSLALAFFPLQAQGAEDLVIPLDLTGPRPAVRVAVGDSEELWVFDTGAAGGVIDIEHARSWGLPDLGPARVGSPVGGTPVEGFRTRVAGARAGAVALPEFSAVAMPFPAHVGAGVLSPNMFSGRLVTLDLSRAELRVHDRAGDPPAEATPYTGAHPLPAIPVTVAGETHLAHMDTGAPGAVTFPFSLAESLSLAAPPERVGMARFVDGERPRYRAQVVGEIQVGPLTLADPQIDLIDGLPFVNVGGQVLRQMTITLDPERRVAWASANG